MITRRRAAVVRYRILPWWGRVVLVYVAARLVSTAMLLLIAAHQERNPWTGARPGYFDFASIWDGHWYFIVAVSGYPSALPLTADGHVGENAWAFMPGYPFLVRVIMTITTMPWEVTTVLVSLIFGLGAALIFFRLMERVLGDARTAMFAVVLFSIAPVSALFQLAYAESMYTFLLVLALSLVIKRSYGWLVPVIAVMALTRPSGLAFALFLGLYAISRFVRRRAEPFPARERLALVAVTAWSGIMGLVWPAVAGLVTGVPTAYTDTELAWRSGYIGYEELVPFAPWIQGANWWLNSQSGFPAGALVLGLIVLAFALSMFVAPVRRLGIELRLWVASYAVYLLAVFFPQSSTFRLLMPMFPLAGAMAVPRSRMYRVSLVVLFLVAQWVWLNVAWAVNGLDWTPP